MVLDSKSSVHQPKPYILRFKLKTGQLLHRRPQTLYVLGHPRSVFSTRSVPPGLGSVLHRTGRDSTTTTVTLPCPPSAYQIWRQFVVWAKLRDRCLQEGCHFFEQVWLVVPYRAPPFGEGVTVGAALPSVSAVLVVPDLDGVMRGRTMGGGRIDCLLEVI